jgi:transposase-like protein
MEGIDIVPPDDAEEFVPPPKRVLFYTLDKKISIVAEAYAVGNSIKSTARKWRVQPNQIRKWRWQLLQDEPIPQYTEPRTIEEGTVIKEQKANKTWHKGRPYTINEGILNGLLAFVEQVRDEDNAVTTTLVTMELLRRAPKLAVVGFVPLRRRVLRFLKNHHLTFCVVTHKAQKHCYYVAIIADYTMYINRQIVASNYGADCILNFDETNIDFDPSPRSTLSKVGERSISIHISGHSGRCTVMLGCTVFKFPAFVIWKGVPNGHID